jgi:hypothetical protein
MCFLGHEPRAKQGEEKRLQKKTKTARTAKIEKQPM